MNRMIRGTRVVALSLLLALPGFGPVVRAGETAVAETLASSPPAADESMFPLVEALAALGAPALADLELAANDAERPLRERIAAAAALSRLGGTAGTMAMERIILDHEAPPAARLEAAEYLGNDDGEYATARMRLLARLDTIPDRVRVALAVGLQRQVRGGGELLEQLYRQSESPIARDEALLALAAVERDPTVYAVDLTRLSRQPGAPGARARAQLTLNARYADSMRRDAVITNVITEVMDQVRNTYNKDETDDDEDKQLTSERLSAVAARAILQSIDPYNDYLDEDDLEAFDQQMNSHYGGIGAWVGLRDKRFTILTPMYNQPAQEAGLRPMDVILEIDGVDIKEMARAGRQNDIIKMLKGPPGTTVALKVARRSWTEPVPFKIRRELIKLESVDAQILPGGIGFLRISSFNNGDPGQKTPGTAELVRNHLRDFQAKNVRGIVLDLTNNPGGLLVAAVETAKQFLGNNQLIVSSRGRPDAPRPQKQEFWANRGPAPCQLPIVCLINGGSASAAEILAGALKDHGRAKLVGQKSFGKGSVQQAMNVLATGGKTNIKLTIAKYYLPSGVCIHREGIQPDIKVTEPSISAAEAESRFLMRDRHEVQFWLEEEDAGQKNRWEREQARFRQLLANDDGDPGKYPGLEELLATLKERHPRQLFDTEILRKEIRFGVASYLRDFLGEKWLVDWVDSYTLQEALLALGDELGGLPDVPEYRGLRERVEKNRLRAAEEKAEGEEEE